MSAMTVIILSGRSLFAEGVAKRLQQFPEHVQVAVIDPRQADALEQIQAYGSKTIILDANDTEAAQLCSLSKVMFSNPETKILRLDSQQDTIQVVSSEKYPAESVQDLMEIIRKG